LPLDEAHIAGAGDGMGLDARRFLPFAPAMVLRVAFASRRRFPFGHRWLDGWRCFFLLRLGQVCRQVSKLLFQGSIFACNCSIM
jgi:hypothetical protein